MTLAAHLLVGAALWMRLGSKAEWGSLVELGLIAAAAVIAG